MCALLYEPEHGSSAAIATEIDAPPDRGAEPTLWDMPIVPSSLIDAHEVILKHIGPYIWSPDAEFEIKLGSIDASGNFAVGVSRVKFDYTHTALSEWNGWDKTTGWRDIKDTIRSDNTRVTEYAHGAEATVIVRKVHVVDIDLTTDTPTALRASLRLEKPVSLPSPSSSSTSSSSSSTSAAAAAASSAAAPYDMLVRMKRRASFVRHFCRFDLTIVWSGATVAKARLAEPTFEIEVEFLASSERARIYRDSYAVLTPLLKATHIAQATAATVHKVMVHNQ